LLTCLANSVNLVIILGMVQVAKKIPFDDPNVLNLCRAAYVVSNIIIVSLYLYIQQQVNKKKGMHAFARKLP
jgi:Phosphate transport (Pho88)